MQVLTFFDMTVVPTMFVDSAAARGMARREGVGKVKALEINTLWLQQIIKHKLIGLVAVASATNWADIGTKIAPAGNVRQTTRGERHRGPDARGGARGQNGCGQLPFPVATRCGVHLAGSDC